jgi:rubrerythrin
MTLTPHRQLPYGVWTTEIIKQYHRAGQTKKAVDLTKKLAGYVQNELDYYNRLQEPFAQSIKSDKRKALHIMYRLVQISKSYNQKELGKKYENYVNQVMSTMQRGTLNRKRRSQ